MFPIDFNFFRDVYVRGSLSYLSACTTCTAPVVTCTSHSVVPTGPARCSRPRFCFWAGSNRTQGPAPSEPTSGRIVIGSLNARSAVNKAPLIRDVINDHSLDILVLTETWFNADMPPAITDSIAPPGYSAQHFMRDGRGGGVSIIHRCSLRATGVKIGIKIASSTSVLTIFGIYRPPPCAVGPLFRRSSHLSERDPDSPRKINSFAGISIVQGVPAIRSTSDLAMWSRISICLPARTAPVE